MQKCPNSCCQCNFICTLWLQRSKILIARSDTILSSARLGRAGRETVSEGLSNGLFPPPSRRSQALAQHVLRVPDHAGILQQQKITAPVLPRAAFQAERGARLPDSKKNRTGAACGDAADPPRAAHLAPRNRWASLGADALRPALEVLPRNPQGTARRAVGLEVLYRAGVGMLAGSSRDGIMNFFMAFSMLLSTTLRPRSSTFINPPQAPVRKMGQGDTWMD